LYIPDQNIAIDQSLTLWKGRLSFQQYIPLKSSKFGVKSYEQEILSSKYFLNEWMTTTMESIEVLILTQG
jgi:hypothetical protein